MPLDDKHWIELLAWLPPNDACVGVISTVTETGFMAESDKSPVGLTPA